MTNVAGRNGSAAETYTVDWIKELLVDGRIVDTGVADQLEESHLLIEDIGLDSLALLELFALVAEHVGGEGLPRQLDLPTLRIGDVLHYCRTLTEPGTVEMT